MDLIQRLDTIVQQERHDWAEEAPYQMQKLKQIIARPSRQFVISNNDYAVYIEREEYDDQEGKVYTLDIAQLSDHLMEYMEHWQVPTIEGAVVDMWLL